MWKLTRQVWCQTSFGAVCSLETTFVHSQLEPCFKEDMAKLFRAAIMGPPGSGKGTISKRIAQSFGLQYLSSGHFLRESIAANSGRIHLPQHPCCSAHRMSWSSTNVWCFISSCQNIFSVWLAEVFNPTTTQLTLPYGFWSGAISFVSSNFLILMFLLKFFLHASSYRNNSENKSFKSWIEFCFPQNHPRLC